MEISRYLVSVSFAFVALGCTSAERAEEPATSALATAVAAADPNAVALGAEHTCAITPAGGVRCWGDNLYGQLGNDSRMRSLVPVDVAGLSSGVKAITAGAYHTCALTANNNVLCWGRNDVGQLGDHSTVDRQVPVGVSTLDDGSTTTLTAGGLHTCIIRWGESVFCWGDNSEGQLGIDSNESQSAPVQTLALGVGTTALGLGLRHSCAIMMNKRIFCWGDNSDGQLGINSTTDQRIPEEIFPLEGNAIQIVAGGGHSCALFSNVPGDGGLTNRIKCWGNNESGQVGIGATSRFELVPRTVVRMDGATNLFTGRHHACATLAGRVRCWGNNVVGQLGNGSTVEASAPVLVSGIAGVDSLSRANSAFHTCAQTSNAGLQCWGNNASGQLGNGSTANSSLPVRVTGF